MNIHLACSSISSVLFAFFIIIIVPTSSHGTVILLIVVLFSNLDILKKIYLFIYYIWPSHLNGKFQGNPPLPPTQKRYKKPEWWNYKQHNNSETFLCIYCFLHLPRFITPCPLNFRHKIEEIANDAKEYRLCFQAIL